MNRPLSKLQRTKETKTKRRREQKQVTKRKRKKEDKPSVLSPISNANTTKYSSTR